MPKIFRVVEIGCKGGRIKVKQGDGGRVREARR